jgi:hypothetical protein
VSLFKPYKVNGKVKPLPPPIIDNHDISYEVECVFNMRLEGVVSVPLNSMSSSGLVMGFNITLGNMNPI